MDISSSDRLNVLNNNEEQDEAKLMHERNDMLT